MRILGIETSCDETSAAVVEDGCSVLSNVIASSQQTFRLLAGVIPEEAARKQVECMMPVLRQALDEAKLSLGDIDAIAVTRGPGLLGSLLVGTTTARAIASVWKKPLIGVHHTLGHLSSTWLQATESPSFPILTLSASGGHTDLWYRTSHLHGSLIGRTRDDAAGEAFDKGASMLALPYPGGPSIAKKAEGGNHNAYKFPSPLHQENTLDFSFSGLKTSLKYLLRDLPLDPIATPDDARIRDIAASFQHGICLHLLDRLEHAIAQFHDAKEVHLVGGVSANKHLRALTQELSIASSIMLRVPATGAFCTDNAAMIAAAGYFLWQESGEDAAKPFDTAASIPLEEVIYNR